MTTTTDGGARVHFDRQGGCGEGRRQRQRLGPDVLVGAGGGSSRVPPGFGGPAAEEACWGGHVQRLVGPHRVVRVYPFRDRCLGDPNPFQYSCPIE